MLKKNEEDGVVAEGPTSETPDQFFLPSSIGNRLELKEHFTRYNLYADERRRLDVAY